MGSTRTRALTTPSRHPERAHHDAATVNSILDEAIFGHLAFVADGLPQALPLLFVRVDSEIFLHSSTGARPARILARKESIEAAFEVTILDELVLARSTFNHSANYRSVVAHGPLRLVTDEGRKASVLEQMVEKIVPGRSSDVRAADGDELRQTAVMSLPLDTAAAKVRTGDPTDEERDLTSSVYAGRLPLLSGRGRPIAAANLDPAVAVPSYLEEPLVTTHTTKR
ncbi:MAG: pyridoxamine 5'-phosphate oxidase family protein [Acidimicrobiales bacterium]